MNMEGDHLKPGLGFIGMGHMGSHMAHRLLDAGYQMTVYDRTTEKAQQVGQRGAWVDPTPKELAANCQVVLVCVTDDEAQHDVMFGPEGALAGTHAGSVIIDLSTVSPDASRRLYQAAKEQGVPMIDAAVSGSVPQVDQEGLLLDVLGQTAVLTPGQKSKLENVRREQYPTNFALSLMHKDFSLVLSQAYDVSVSMPATAAAQQMYAAAMAKGMDADFSIMIQFMEELAGLSTARP
jgi:3-hydroxyisobutyrate dehydrogenase-like beta-hydroxyacid dehydrogenase